MGCSKLAAATVTLLQPSRGARGAPSLNQGRLCAHEGLWYFDHLALDVVCVLPLSAQPKLLCLHPRQPLRRRHLLSRLRRGPRARTLAVRVTTLSWSARTASARAPRREQCACVLRGLRGADRGDAGFRLRQVDKLTRALQGARVQRALHFHSPPLVWEAWQQHAGTQIAAVILHLLSDAALHAFVCTPPHTS